MNRSSPLLSLAVGFTIWAIGFAVIYAVQGAGCAYGWDRIALGPISFLRLVLIMLTVATAAIIYVVARALSGAIPVGEERDARHFLLSVAAWAAVLAVPATLFTFSGVFIATACS